MVGIVVAWRLAPTRYGWVAAVALSVLATPRLLIYQLSTLVAALREPRSGPPAGDRARMSGRPARRRPNPVWLALGVVGWAGLAWLAVQMYSATPRTAAFDLELLLQAGRDVAAGRSPYDPAMVAGGVPGAADLFYSYPPPVAQAMSLFAAVPSGAMFAALWVLAVAGLAYGAALVSRRLAPGQPVAATVLPTLAVAPLFLPFGIALLFGNLDALFPLAYALVLVAAVAPTRRSSIAGGIALGLATIAKVHPAGLGPWFVGRARPRAPVRAAGGRVAGHPRGRRDGCRGPRSELAGRRCGPVARLRACRGRGQQRPAPRSAQRRAGRAGRAAPRRL